MIRVNSTRYGVGGRVVVASNDFKFRVSCQNVQLHHKFEYTDLSVIYSTALRHKCKWHLLLLIFAMTRCITPLNINNLVGAWCLNWQCIPILLIHPLPVKLTSAQRWASTREAVTCICHVITFPIWTYKSSLIPYTWVWVSERTSQN